MIAEEYANGSTEQRVDLLRMAERALLGCLLIGAPIPDRLSSSDFASDEHRVVFEAISELEAEREAVDSLTVGYRIIDTGRLKRIHSMSSVSALLDALRGLGSVDSVDSYARIVRDEAKRRRLKL